jgi:hypothetical protein
VFARRKVRQARPAAIAAQKALSYVYYENKLGRRTAAGLLTRDEARRIAINIAKLPELAKMKRRRD